MRFLGQDCLTKLAGMGEVARYKDKRNAGWPDGYDGSYPLGFERRYSSGRRRNRPGIDYPIRPNVWPNGRPNGKPQICWCGFQLSNCHCGKYPGRIIGPRQIPHIIREPHHPPVYMCGPGCNHDYDPGYDPRFGGPIPPMHYTCCDGVHPPGHYPINEDDVFSSTGTSISWDRTRPTHYHAGHHDHRHGGHGMHDNHHFYPPPPHHGGHRGYPHYPDAVSLISTDDSY